MTWNPPNTDGVLPPPQPKAAAPAPPEPTAPTPEEVAADVAARQAAIDAQKAAGQPSLDPAGDPDGARKAAEAAAAAAAERSTVPPDSTQKWKAPTSFPSDPAEAAARNAAAAAAASPAPAPAPVAATAPANAEGAVAPASSEPVSQAPRGYAAEAAPKRTPKYLLGAFLKIPGGFSGRVVKVFNDYDEMAADEEVVAAGGPEVVLRGRQGTGTPSTKEQPFYRCRSNRFDYDLVVGELDGHMIQQGTGAPQE
jgi:hypothetical protein